MCDDGAALLCTPDSTNLSQDADGSPLYRCYLVKYLPEVVSAGKRKIQKGAHLHFERQLADPRWEEWKQCAETVPVNQRQLPANDPSENMTPRRQRW